MNLRNWFQFKKQWLQGGLKGIVVCIILFLFYIAVYFPIINNIYAEDIAAYGGTPAWTTTLPTITGHIIPIFSGFIVPYGFLCMFSETICVHWSTTPEPGSVPWILETGEVGYCVEQSMVPTTACADFSEKVGFFGLAFLLLTVYFIVGAAVGWLREKRKR